MQYPSDALTSSAFFDKEKDAFQFMEIKKKPRNTKKALKSVVHEEQPTQPSIQNNDKKEEEGRGRRNEGKKRKEDGKREDEKREDVRREEGRREDEMWGNMKKEDEGRKDRGIEERGKETGKEERELVKGEIFGEVVESVIKSK